MLTLPRPDGPLNAFTVRSVRLCAEHHKAILVVCENIMFVPQDEGVGDVSPRRACKVLGSNLRQYNRQFLPSVDLREGERSLWDICTGVHACLAIDRGRGAPL
jgi:hypothetical protein